MHVSLCRAVFSKDTNLIEVDCVGCNFQPDLRRTECFSGAVLSLDPKLTVDRILLRGRTVKSYSRRGVELLSRVRSILDSIRGAAEESHQRLQLERSAKELKRCRQCKSYPEKLFLNLEAALLSDFSEFFSLLQEILKAMKPDGVKCRLCIDQVRTDAIMVLEKALSFRRFALREGMGIKEV